MEQNMLVSIDDDALDNVSGGFGCFDPCALLGKLVEKKLEIVGGVVCGVASIAGCALETAGEALEHVGGALKAGC